MKNERLTDIQSSGAEQREKGKKNIAKILVTVALSVVLLVFYRFSLAFEFFPYVMMGYMVALTVLVLVYILYNRGFSRKGVTVDMLPDDWSEERKNAFVDSAKKRMKRSSWMLIFMIGFLVTFLFDAIELFAIPFFKGLF